MKIPTRKKEKKKKEFDFKINMGRDAHLFCIPHGNFGFHVKEEETKTHI